MFDQSTFSTITGIAKSRGSNPSALAAVVDVESNGEPMCAFKDAMFL